MPVNQQPASAPQAQSTEDQFWESGGSYRATDHPVVEIFARQRIAYLQHKQALAQVKSILDIGSGSGFSSRYYPERMQVVAADYAGGMLARNPTPNRTRCSGARLPFADDSFDLATCWELLHHLEDPIETIREMFRVTRKRMILFEPNRIHPGHIYLGLTRAEERRSLLFSPGYMRRLLRQAIGRSPDVHERCGLLFPNITPFPVAKLMRKFPYRMPVIGISQLLIVEK